MHAGEDACVCTAVTILLLQSWRVSMAKSLDISKRLHTEPDSCMDLPHDLERSPGARSNGLGKRNAEVAIGNPARGDLERAGRGGDKGPGAGRGHGLVYSLGNDTIDTRCDNIGKDTPGDYIGKDTTGCVSACSTTDRDNITLRQRHGECKESCRDAGNCLVHNDSRVVQDDRASGDICGDVSGQEAHAHAQKEAASQGGEGATKAEVRQALARVCQCYPAARPARGSLKQVYQFARAVLRHDGMVRGSVQGS
jgi:hypothetical protein